MPFRSYFENFATVEGFDDGSESFENTDNSVEKCKIDALDNFQLELQNCEEEKQQQTQPDSNLVYENGVVDSAKSGDYKEQDDQEIPELIPKVQDDQDDQDDQEVPDLTPKQVQADQFEDTVEGFNGGSHNDLLDQRLLLKSLLFGLLFYLLANNDTYKMTKQLTKGLDKVLIHAVVFSVFYYIIQTMI